MRVPVVLALLALVGAIAPVDRAGAHASLRGTEPADGGQVSVTPAQIELTFDEEVSPISITLVDSVGRVVVLPETPRANGTKVEARLPATLAPGVYVAAWRVTSADSHPVGGAFVFAIGTAIPAGFVAPRIEPAAGWHAANIVLRFAVTLAALACVGGAFFAVAVAPLGAALRKRLASVAAVGAATALLAIAVRGGLLLGLDGFDASPTRLWEVGAASRFGTSMLVLSAGLAALAVAWLVAASARMVAAAAGLGALASFMLSGHFAAAASTWLMAGLLGLHVVVAAFWLGSMLPLVAALRGPIPEAASRVRRFSRLAQGAVAVLIAAGAALAISQFDRVDDVAGTSYGRILLWKLAGVVALLLLAAVNKLVFTPALKAGEARASRRLRLAILSEIVVACCVVAVTSRLTLTPPPRAELHRMHHDQHHDHDMEDDGLVLNAAGRRVAARIEIAPGRAGHNRIVVELFDLDRKPFAARELAIEFAHAKTGIAGLRRILTPRESGGHVLEGPELAMSGSWTIRLEVLVTDFELDTFSAEFDLP